MALSHVATGGQFHEREKAVSRNHSNSGGQQQCSDEKKNSEVLKSADTQRNKQENLESYLPHLRRECQLQIAVSVWSLLAQIDELVFPCLTAGPRVERILGR